MEHSHGKEATNIDLFNNPLPCRLSINDEFVPNVVFDQTRLVPLFMIEHLVVTFNPNGAKSDAEEKMPNFGFLVKLLGNPFPNKVYFQ